jgi:hypothetical protein
MFRRALSRALPACAAAAIAGVLVTVPFSSVASAAAPTEGSQVPGSAIPLTGSTYTHGAPFSSGQTIQVDIPANTVFAPGAGINVLECGLGTGGALPTSPSQCDGNTIQGSTITACNSSCSAGAGSFDYTQYTIYALPDSISLGETSDHTPVCNVSNPCVLYIGENQNDFTQPHVWSQTFVVKPTSGDTGANPGDGTPEAPLAIGLPILAIGIIGGTLFLRKRRSAQHHV